jgi:ATP-dependent exoDNAse (exonuclease V) alpha subunit
MLIELQGQIERITYTSEESGFTIARVKVPGHRDLVCVVGNLLAPMPGEIIKMRGEWANHPKFGEQFKIVYYKSMVPATVHGKVMQIKNNYDKEVFSGDIGRITQIDQELFGSRSFGLRDHHLAKGWCYLWISPQCHRQYLSRRTAQSWRRGDILR